MGDLWRHSEVLRSDRWQCLRPIQEANQTQNKDAGSGDVNFYFPVALSWIRSKSNSPSP